MNLVPGSQKPASAVAAQPVPSLAAQADRLVSLGVHQLGGWSAAELSELAGGGTAGSLFVTDPKRVPASVLAPLLQREDKRGFVVVDMTDVDSFTPIEQVAVPDGPGYLVTGVDRGDELANWSPDEALPAILATGRTPLTLVEGLHWVLQQPAALERNHCFMTIGTRLRKPNGRLDARTPAIWISNGTGRDGRDARGAPKLGWCWAGNRHTWLGFASAAGRSAIEKP
ncbi:MAG: DUF5701 family protein [Nakamurella sp.]